MSKEAVDIAGERFEKMLVDNFLLEPADVREFLDDINEQIDMHTRFIRGHLIDRDPRDPGVVMIVEVRVKMFLDHAKESLLRLIAKALIHKAVQNVLKGLTP